MAGLCNYLIVRNFFATILRCWRIAHKSYYSLEYLSREMFSNRWLGYYVGKFCGPVAAAAVVWWWWMILEDMVNGGG